MRGTKRIGAAVRIWVVLALIGAGPAGTSEAQAPVLVDRVLAVVSGTIITLSDVRIAMALGFVDTAGTPDPVAAALTQLVERRLVLDEALRYGPQEPDFVSVEAMAWSARRRFATQAEWDAATLRLGVDDDVVRQLAGDVLQVEQFLADRFDTQPAPGDADLRDAFARWGHELTTSGRRLTFDEARPALTARLRAERRNQAAREWVSRLRRRADVSELYMPVR